MGACESAPTAIFEAARDSDRGDFWAQPVEILVFASPTSYMLTASGFPLLNWGVFCKFLYNDR